MVFLYLYLQISIFSNVNLLTQYLIILFFVSELNCFLLFHRDIPLFRSSFMLYAICLLPANIVLL